MNAPSSLPELRTVTLGAAAGKAAGLRIAYREAGDAASPAVLTMHGIGSNASGYRNQLRDLSNRFRIISWDAPGYGGSDPFTDNSPSAADYADAAAGLLAALGVSRAHVVGSSLGAIYGAKLAATHPALVRSLVLSAPATGFGSHASGEGEAHAKGRIADLERLGAKGLADERAARLVAPGSPAEVLRVAHEVVASIKFPGYAQAARILGGGNIFLDTPLIKAPTLILVGDLDRVTPLDLCAGPIHEAIAGSRLEVLQGCAHLIKIEAADRFNALVSGFFDQHRK